MSQILSTGLKSSKKKFVISGKKPKKESSTAKIQSMPLEAQAKETNEWISSNTRESSAPIPFDSIVASVKESQEENAPKKRGRPPKSQSNASSAKPSEADTNTPPLSVQAPPVPSEVLIPFIKMPFNLWANKTGCEKLKLENEMAEMIAPQLSAVIQQYLPLLSGAHSALLLLCTTVASVVVAKILILNAWKEEMRNISTGMPA